MNYYFEKEAQNEKRDHLNMINAFELLKSFGIPIFPESLKLLKSFETLFFLLFNFKPILIYAPF